MKTHIIYQISLIFALFTTYTGPNLIENKFYLSCLWHWQHIETITFGLRQELFSSAQYRNTCIKPFNTLHYEGHSQPLNY